jgi:uncharacterized Zn-binding protein involved in type VI secretion
MALSTARMNDPQACDSHGPAPLPDGALSVRVNSLPTVRVGDAFKCGGCANRVQTGASTVTFGGEFAARVTDKSDHGGRIVIGSANVVIGGPMGMGCIGAGKSTCQAMAAGRKSGRTKQSYGNCMPESLRQLIRRATGKMVTEDEVLGYGLAKGLSDDNPGKPNRHGATSPQDAILLLQHFGVAAENVPASGSPTLNDIKRTIADRKGVVTTLHTKDYWPGSRHDYHAVVVTGVELDSDGNVIAVFINDTGVGECGMKVPANKFAAAIKSGGDQPLVVTKGNIW